MKIKGQCSLEYTALITVVAAVILSVFIWSKTPNPDSFQQKLTQAFRKIGDKIVHEINQVR